MDLFDDISGVLSTTSFDPNDTFDTAAALTEGSYDIAGNGVDWYSFEVLSGDMTLTMTPTAGALQELNMILFNDQGQGIRTGFTPSGEEVITQTAPAPGTYYVQVTTAQFGDTPPDGTQMAYTLSLDLPDADPAEANDTRATAPTLGNGTFAFYGSSVDYHKLESVTGPLTLSMTAGPQDSATADNLNMILRNSAGTVVASNFNPTSNESFTYNVTQAGDYFVQIFSAPFPDGAPNGTRLSYALNVDLPEQDAAEANDTILGAERLTSGTYNRTGTSVDWFTFDSGPGLLEFAMTPQASGDTPALDLNMELYDADGTLLRGNFSGGATTESFDLQGRQDATYFLKIYNAPFPDGAPNGTVLSYRLDIDLPVNTWTTELEFGPIRNASIAAYDIDGDGKDEIFVGTSKKLDAQGNEVLPAGLIALEDDGTVKWTKTFAAQPGVDRDTGKTYTTTSVSTAPVFSDVNGDGTIDIVVGVGADNRGDFNAAGQPGDMGGVYALDADGNELWSHINIDSFGGGDSGPDGRADGTYGTPRVFDIDADGVREVIFSAWDHNFYILDGRTGAAEVVVDLHDTAGATPALADLNRDGLFELVVPADITTNEAAGLPAQGGILHVLSNYGQQNIPGWDAQVGTTTQNDFRGKFEPQSLWSSPKIVDLDRDGTPEIVVGTGNFFQDGSGQYIKVWNADGTQRAQLDTIGRTLAAPLIADLDGDGSMEIIATTISGYVHAWNAAGTEVFRTSVQPFISETTPDQELPIARQAIAVDIDNADNDLEILLSIGSRMIVLDSDGTQITNTTKAENVFNSYSGAPLAKDVDNDGLLDLISGGTTTDLDQAVVYRFENIVDVSATSYRTAEYQDSQSLHNIRDFVERLYTTILDRGSDPAGNNDWTDELYSGVLSGADVARGFIGSREFQSRGTTDADYVNILYAAFFGRAADQGGFDGWIEQLNNGTSRDDVLGGFVGSREFANLATSFGIRPQAGFGAEADTLVIRGDEHVDTSTLRGDARNNVIFDEGTSVDTVDATGADVSGQVFRLYGATLDRSPDAGGFLSWYDGLTTDPTDGGVMLPQVAGAFVNSREFSNTYGDLDNDGFVELLYNNVLNRASDADGLQGWLNVLENGGSRADVVLGFSESREYVNTTTPDLVNFMRVVEPKWNDVIEGGAGDDAMNGGIGSDTFVFRGGRGGNDVIHGFEAWDQLQLSGFGLSTAAQALSRMSQQGTDVLFAQGDQRITFLNTSLADMARVKYNLS